jgi:hypothetical protein
MLKVVGPGERNGIYEKQKNHSRYYDDYYVIRNISNWIYISARHRKYLL